MNFLHAPSSRETPDPSAARTPARTPLAGFLASAASLAWACSQALAAALRRLLGRPLLSQGQRPDGPPDVEEAWKELTQKFQRLFGRGGAGGPQGPRPEPDMKSAGIGLGLVGGVVALLWLGSGVFIVQEGQQAVVMSFGKYSKTVGAGIQWRWPSPLQTHETVSVTQLQSVEVGRTALVPATGLRDSSMLTQDENIVDIQFTVQYRLSDPKAYLFENHRPDDAVVQAAESAVREIVGRSNMDSVLYEQRDAIATELVKSVQTQLDRLKTGIQVANVNVRNVQAPEQVQAAFDDAFKAGADRERLKNEGQAYANDVIPKAQGTAARLREEAEAYKARVVAQAEGDSQRFASVLTEYQRAPAVTRDRMYIDTMQQIYSNVSKVMVDTRGNSSLLYLPLDKLLQNQGAPAAAAPVLPAAPSDTNTVQINGSDARSREGSRGRDRDGR
jgi:membrane protease subunit HflK